MRRQLIWGIGLFFGLTMLILVIQGHHQSVVEAQEQSQAKLLAQISQTVNRYVPAVNAGIVKPSRTCGTTSVESPLTQLKSNWLPPGQLARSIPKYHPKEVWQKADPSNYGKRFSQDIYGNSVYYPLLVVVHETVGSLESAVSLFQTFHPYDADQVSYHTIIGLDGRLVYTVPPENRAYGAGNSEFHGEAVKTNPRVASSVNNFAYHISLETPLDGMHEYSSHSGYTDAQYRSLAWLVARTRVGLDRVVYHRDVDRDGERNDPRSFDQAKFAAYLSEYDIIYQADCTLMALTADQPKAATP